MATTLAIGDMRAVQEQEPQIVFTGLDKRVSVTLANSGDEMASADLRIHLLQTSSSTAMPVGETFWKKLQVLPGQTVLEQAALDFPNVKAETKFLVQWIAGTNQVLGTTEVMVYPTNLLAELNSLAGEELPVGVFDPNNILKPLLKTLSVEFEDMEDCGVTSFRGKLAIIGPFNSPEQTPSDMTERVEKLVRHGAGVVWIQPPQAPRAKLKPSFETLPIGNGTVIIVQPELTADLANSPQAQLNLIELCRLARESAPPRLSDPNER